MNDKLTLRQVIERAGGILVVAQKLNYGHAGVTRWYYGSRCPLKSGRIRADLCRLAGVSMENVLWKRTATRAALERETK